MLARRVFVKWLVALAAAMALASHGLPVANANPDSDVPATGTIAQSPVGLMGCGAPFYNGINRDYCFVIQQVVGGLDDGNWSVFARYYYRPSDTLAVLMAEDSIVASSSAIQVKSDGSFQLALQLPNIGDVQMTGSNDAYFEHTGISFYLWPLKYSIAASTPSVVPYLFGRFSQVVDVSVNGDSLPDHDFDLWNRPVSGTWEMSSVF